MINSVELRYFAGLSIEATAAVLNVSPATVKRDWQMAKAWLHHQIAECGLMGRSAQQWRIFRF